MSRALLGALGVVVLAACGSHESDTRELDFMEETRLKYETIRREELHVGMTREEVRAVLGTPTEEDAKGFHYDVGGYWLDALFDEQDKLRETLLNGY